MALNLCLHGGRMTHDLVITPLPNNKNVLNFRIAVNSKFKRAGNQEQETAFLDCEAWDTGAETIAKYFKKGDYIIVHSEVKQQEWEDKNGGGRRSKLIFRVNRFEFPEGNAKREGDGETASSEPTQVATKTRKSKAAPQPSDQDGVPVDGEIPF